MVSRRLWIAAATMLAFGVLISLFTGDDPAVPGLGVLIALVGADVAEIKERHKRAYQRLMGGNR